MEVVVLNVLRDRNECHTFRIELLDKLREVGQRPRERVHL